MLYINIAWYSRGSEKDILTQTEAEGSPCHGYLLTRNTRRFLMLKPKNHQMVWWLTYIISASESQRWEDSKFGARLDYVVRQI